MCDSLLDHISSRRLHIFHSTFNRRMAWIDEKNANWLSIYIGPSNRLGGMAQQRFMQAWLKTAIRHR